jgi:hypothetical protein
MFQNAREWSNIIISISATTLSDSIDLVLEWSPDGTNFYEYSTTTLDINSSDTFYTFDLTDHYFPYIRYKLDHTASDVVKYSYMLYEVNK